MKKIKILGIILTILGIIGILGVVGAGISKTLNKEWLLIYGGAAAILIVGMALIGLWIDQG